MKEKLKLLGNSKYAGCTWTPKRPLSKLAKGLPCWNCALISLLKDGQIAVLVDRVAGDEKLFTNCPCFSKNMGKTWNCSQITHTPGIVPDELLELSSGRWILSCHYSNPVRKSLEQRLWYSNNQGKSWRKPHPTKLGKLFHAENTIRAL